MPIRVACTECDKKLSVRDVLAGKKVKCPGCGSVFIAAALGGSTAVKAASPKLAPPSAKDNVSAKPMAKRPAPPPIDNDEDLDERPTRGKKPIARDDDDEDSNDRPARGKGKRGKPAAGGSKLWLWLVLAGILVIGGGLGVYFVFFNGAGGGPIAKGNQGKQGGIQGGGGNQTGQNHAAGGNIALADLVPGDAFFFASVSGEAYNAKALEGLKPLFGKQIEDAFQKETGVPIGDVQAISAFSVGSFAEAQKNPQIPPFVIVAQTKRPFNEQQVTAAFQAGDLGKNKMMTLEFAGGQMVMMGAPTILQAYKAKKGAVKATGVLERALAKASTSTGVVIAMNIPPEAVQMVGPAAQMAPASLLKAQALLISFDLTDKLQLNASIVLDDAATATQLKKDADEHLAKAAQLIVNFIPEPQAAKLLQKMLADLKINAQDKELTVAFQADAAVAIGMILPAIQKVREASTSTAGLNNLKQIVLAWHGYHDRNKMMPPQTIGKGLSWRVAILPYIEQQNLYSQFKLDEPWDSAHNKKLIPLMPKVYESPSRQAGPGMTYYQSFVGPNTVNKNPMKGMMFQQITDGTSNTILIAEAANAVEWTKPADIQVAPNQPIVLGGDNSGTQAARADGSCLRLPRNLDQQILRLLIDPQDNMPIPDFSGPGKK